MGKYTITGTTRLYLHSTFIQDLCPSHLSDIEDHVLVTDYADGSMAFVVGDDTTDALKAHRWAKIFENGFQMTV